MSSNFTTIDRSVMFEPKPNPRASAFERPSTMRHPLNSSFDVGKSTWSHDRSIWNSSNTSTIRTNEGDATKPHVSRQDSVSSLKFGRLPNNVPLSPLENPRTTNPSSGMGWVTAAAGRSESQLRSQLTSPTKQTQSSWLYNNRSDVDVENSSLLAGSAPDSEYFDVSTVRDQVAARNFHRHAEKDHSAANRFEDTSSSSPAGFRPYHETRAQVSIGNIKSVKESATESFPGHFMKPQELIEPVSETAPPNTRGFGRGSAFRNGTLKTTPTHSRFSRQTAFDAYIHGGGAGLKTPSEEQGHAFSGLSIDQKGGALATHQGEGYANEFSHAVNGSFSAHQSQNSQLHLSFPTDFGGNGAAPSSEPSHTHTPGHYQSIWNYGDQGTLSPSASDIKYHLSSPYYSATGTPPTGPESVRSAAGSGISSRTSHHEFALVDRKLRNLQLYQPYQHTQSNGFLPVPGPGYDLSIHHSTMRMNPLAAPYHVGGNDGFPGRFGPNHRMPPYEPDQVQIIRSPLLEEFRMSSKTNKRYELRDIFNYVVEFSGDQHGSRFIQQKLETANSDEKDQIFKEISPNSLQLMTDVFGNYVIQKLFEYGNQSQKKVLANHMKGHVLTLSTQMYGCRVVQKALEHVLIDQQASMVKELEGPNKQILKVIRDQNGNHVVQKAIERVPAEHIQFIIEAHRGEVVKLATHTYGCRVIQRILEHCAPVAKRVILDELHGCVGPLITDSFGNYVVQHVIQNGEPDDRRRVVSIVQQQLLIFSKHKFASNVEEKCIEYADDDQRGDIVAKLIGHNEQGQTPVLGLLRDQYGNYVIQRIHSVLKGAEFEALTNEMKLCFPQLRRTSYGKQVMAIEKLLYGVSGPQSAISTSTHSSTMDVSNASHGSEEHPRGVRSMQQGQTQVMLAVGL